MKFSTDVDELEAFVCVSVLVNYTAVDVTRVSDTLWNMFRKPVYEGPGSLHIDSGERKTFFFYSRDGPCFNTLECLKCFLRASFRKILHQCIFHYW